MSIPNILNFNQGEAQIIWATQNIDQVIADIARASAPENIGNDPYNLIGYTVREKHWSPFEMANVCLGFVTTRDIGRQILRHSLKPQEFSQRYADVRKLGNSIFREARLQDSKNRQNSFEIDDAELQEWWLNSQSENWDNAIRIYGEALKKGIAKEVARAVLPEGNTPSLMYFNGFLRNWLHFCQLRMDKSTQKECRLIATSIYEKLKEVAPITCAAFTDNYGVGK